jgi:hypothetical protein
MIPEVACDYNNYHVLGRIIPCSYAVVNAAAVRYSHLRPFLTARASSRGGQNPLPASKPTTHTQNQLNKTNAVLLELYLSYLSGF